MKFELKQSVWAAGMVAGVVLAGCGGGDEPADTSANSVVATLSPDGADSASNAAPVDTASGEADVQAMDATTATQDGTKATQAVTTWTRVASEGGKFVISGVRTVRYGAGTAWIQRALAGTYYCVTPLFGSDPAPNVAKTCEVASTTDAPAAPAPAPAPTSAPTAAPAPAAAASGWTRIATEGARFTVSGTRTVRYGAGNAWFQRSITGSSYCINSAFGGDPAPNVAKTCEVAASPTAAPAPSPAPAPTPAPSPAPSPSPAPAPAAWGTAKSSARLFVSGHSLTDNPLADDVVSIASSISGSQAAKYNQQIVIGSPIRVRTGMPSSLSGYSSGKNRSGSNMNVLQELASGSSIGGDRYDTLVITENHNLLDMLQWESTVQQLRHYHDRFISSNSSAQTYLYASWWDVNKSDPRAWIAAERTIASGWQCVASRVNQSLALQGRSDRILPLPASTALADLVERATQGNLPGISDSSVSATMNRLFSDNVHLTRLGAYYMALVTYSSIFQRSPVGSAPPSGITATEASSLQSQAWYSVSTYYANTTSPSLSDCQTTVMPQVCNAYWTLRGNSGNVASCSAMFRANTTGNPLYYDAATDAGFWFPANP